jgi:hypothetical protein
LRREGAHNFYTSPVSIKIIKKRRTRRVGYVTCTGYMCTECELRDLVADEITIKWVLKEHEPELWDVSCGSAQ